MQTLNTTTTVTELVMKLKHSKVVRYTDSQRGTQKAGKEDALNVSLRSQRVS